MAARKWGNERTIGYFNAVGGGNGKEWDVAALDGGGYVVTWIDRTTLNSTARGQRYDAAGNPIGIVFEIGATVSGNNKSDIVVTGIDGGGFVVAFVDSTNAGDPWYERYDAAGVVQSTIGFDGGLEAESNLAITRIAGGFVIAETDQFEDGVNADGIWYVRYDVNDVGQSFPLINSDALTGLQTDPSITTLTDGKIVVSWVDHNDNTVKFRVVDSTNDNPLTASIVVDDDPFVTGVPEVSPQVVGLANGNFLIVWQESGEPDSGDQSGYAVRGMIYSAAGTPQSGVLLINSLHTGDQFSPDIVATPDGGFFVSWTSLPSGFNSDIKGLQFGPGGFRVGAEITINTTTSGIDIDPHMTVLADGRIVVVWNEANTGILRSQIIDPRDGLVTGTANTETLYGNDLFNDEMNGLSGADTMFGLAGADTMFGGEGTDVLHGGRGDDTLYGGAGTDSLFGGLGDDEVYGGADGDILYSSAGLDLFDGEAGNDIIYYSAEAIGATINLNNSALNAGSALGDTLLNIERISATNQADVLIGNASANTFAGNAGADRLDGGIGADVLVGGTGSDSFVFAVGQSGSLANTLDRIADYTKGAVGVGDEIDYSSALVIGGSTAAATATQASINGATGVATFAAGSGTTLADALADITTRMTAATTAAGEFAFFEINGTGDTYMFISDAVAGLGAGDVVVRMTGITDVLSINITAGDVTILT